MVVPPVARSNRTHRGMLVNSAGMLKLPVVDTSELFNSRVPRRHLGLIVQILGVIANLLGRRSDEPDSLGETTEILAIMDDRPVSTSVSTHLVRRLLPTARSASISALPQMTLVLSVRWHRQIERIPARSKLMALRESNDQG